MLIEKRKEGRDRESKMGTLSLSLSLVEKYLRDVFSYEGFKEAKCYLRKLDRTRNKKRNKSASRRIRSTVSLGRSRFHSHGFSLRECPGLATLPFCLLTLSIDSRSGLSLDGKYGARVVINCQRLKILGVLHHVSMYMCLRVFLCFPLWQSNIYEITKLMYY